MKRKFQLKKYTAVFIAVLMLISSIGMVGVSAGPITATFDADKNMIIENTTEGVVSNNNSAVVTGTDVVFSAGGSVTYEISNVPETGWYAISTVGRSSAGSSVKYYAMSVTHNGNKSASAATHQNYVDTTIKAGTIYLEQGVTNQFVIACDSVGIDAKITLKQLKIEKDTAIPVSTEDETRLSVFDYSNRSCRYTNHSDDDAPTKVPASGSDETSWKGKATTVANSYVSYNVSVAEKTTYDIYSAVGSPSALTGTLSVDNGDSISKTLTASAYARAKLDKLATVELEPGIHTIKLTLSGTGYLWGIKLVPVGGDMQIKSVKQDTTTITTDTPVNKSTDNFDITFKFAPLATDITSENISIIYDGDKKVSAEFAVNDRTVSVNLKEALTPDTTYTLNLKNIKASQGTGSAIPESTYTFITSGEVVQSGRVVCDSTESEYETIKLNLTAYSSKDVKIKGRNVEVYRKAPVTVNVPAPEDVLIATTVTGDNGAINIVDEIPLSSALYPDGFPYGAYTYTIKCDYCADLPIEIIYISRAREAELLGKLKDTTSVNDGSADGTDDDVEPFFETYQTELGVDLDADLVNILDRSKVYRHFIGAELDGIEVFKEKYDKAIYTETINCATESTKANIEAILNDEAAQNLFNMPKDKLSIVLDKDSAGIVNALMALDEITSLDEADDLIKEEIENVFMTICGKADVSFDSSVLSLSVRNGQSIELPLKLSTEIAEVKNITLKIKSDDTTFTENVTVFNMLEDAAVTHSWDAGVLTVELAYPFKTTLSNIGSVTLTPAVSSTSHTIKVSGTVTYDVNLDKDESFGVAEDIPVIGGINEALYTVTVTQSSSGVTQGPSTTRPSTPSTPAPSRPSTPSTPSTPVNPDPIEPDVPDVPDVPDAPKGFTDIDDVSWATESINKLLELGVVSESEDGKFNPNNNIKRSEFIKLIVEALDLNDESAASSFTDVAEDAWYYEYAAAAQKAGIVLGGDDGKFNPESYITRQDMSVIIARALELYGIKADEEKGQLFDDDESISDYAKAAIYLLKSLEIINGTGENNFTPLGNATRAQTAKMVCGIIEVVSK